MKKRFRITLMLCLLMMVMTAMPCFATEAAQETRATIDLTPVFQAAIALLAALVTRRLVPWIKSKTTENQQNMMMSVVRTMVFAAEQLYGAGNGAAKLEYVKRQLIILGYDVDTALIKNAIESMIKELSFEEGVTHTEVFEDINTKETEAVTEAEVDHPPD